MFLKERVTRLEEKAKAAKEALKLARKSLSRNGVLSVITVVIAFLSIIGTIIGFFIKKMTITEAKKILAPIENDEEALREILKYIEKEIRDEKSRRKNDCIKDSKEKVCPSFNYN
jgi:uncharacterized protein YneF (UPF0154 family)